MRRTNRRAVLLTAIVVVVLLAVGGYAWHAWHAQRTAVEQAPPVDTTALDAVLAVPHLVFRSTLPGPQYGLVAAVPLSDPGGPRAFTTLACDRIDVAGRTGACLRTQRGIATTFDAVTVDTTTWEQIATWALPGIPSRTRVSDDGTLVGTTAFVTGHSYATVGFSTQTEIHRSDGTSLGNIEDWLVVVDGSPLTAVDRNLWGVTFVDDDTFYATVASQSAGTTWLVRGSISSRTMIAQREGAECPSVSPDRTHVAYKKVVDSRGAQTVWALAVLDLASGTETLLPATEGLDDQAEWLDDDTLLYGLPRPDEAGTTDVWAVDLAPGSEPSVLVPGAWSPAVAR